DAGLLGALVGRKVVLPGWDPGDDGDDSSEPPPDARAVLLRLADWWQRNRGEWLRTYLDWVYPDHLRAHLTPQGTLSLPRDHLGGGAECRRRWLSLFILGMTHTVGFGGATNQQHRGFLELCHRERYNGSTWLDVFADPDVQGRRGDWLGLV